MQKETPSLPETPCIKNPIPESGKFTSHLDAALSWHKFGLNVIPIIPEAKQTAVKWDPWLNGLSPEKIKAHWTRHPDHEVGFIVTRNIAVLDADSQESSAALHQLENTFDATPNLIIKTKKGCHHYFRLKEDVFAKTDSHSTKEHPNRIDVKTNRSMVILPPSTGKEIDIIEANSIGELVAVGQEFIDAVFRHNGRDVPRPLQEKAVLPHPSSQSQSETIARLEALLKHIDPDCGYEDWLHVLMAIFHETGGSEEGFQLADAWSSQGKTYKGSREIRVKWDSFKSYQGKPITIATLVKKAKDNGADISQVYPGLSEQFDRCDTEVVAMPTLPFSPNPLDKFSLLGKSEELEKHAVEEVFVMGEVVLKGQATAIYAAPNTGKTLLTFSLLTECIRLGRIDPAKLYYLNMDDTGTGLREKVRLAEEYGFHVLAEGHQDFMVNTFVGTINVMIESEQCKDVVIVLDTLKKFTNLMDKGKSSGFAKVIRRFVVKGGTLIALAHTNKNPGQNGKPVYGGTTDIVDDFDCAYTLAMVSTDQATKVVEFENFKRRGNVAPTAAYSYSVERGISYAEILLSVKPIDPAQIEPIKQAEAIKADTEIIAAVAACIADGVNTKMNLATEVSRRTGISKRSALQIIEKYTGADPAVHRWNFTVVERGAKVFVMLPPPATSHGDISG